MKEAPNDGASTLAAMNRNPKSIVEYSLLTLLAACALSAVIGAF